MARVDSLTTHRTGATVVLGAVLLLLSMCLQWSFGPAYLVRLHHVRHEMKAHILSGLSEDRITSLHFPASAVESIEWADGGREVRDDGHLFDIVSVSCLSDGSVVVRAVRDDQEAHVLAELDRDVRQCQGHDATGKERGSRIISAWAAYCAPFVSVNVPMPPEGEREYGNGPHLPQRFPAIVDPEPPRIA
jgi:hypothetical protein